MIWEPNTNDLAAQRDRITQEIKAADMLYSFCVFMLGATIALALTMACR